MTSFALSLIALGSVINILGTTTGTTALYAVAIALDAAAVVIAIVNLVRTWKKK